MSTLDPVLEATDSPAVARLRGWIESYASTQPIRRVAVIGNAPLPPSAPRAELIDTSDLVIRCNSFVLDEPGALPCLGTRTNLVLLAKVTLITPSVFRDYRSRAYLVPEAGQARPLGRRHPPVMPSSWPADLGQLPIPNDVIGLPLRRLLVGSEFAGAAVPTTGTLAAYLGYALFPDVRIDLIGFSFLHDRTQTTWRHHYGSEVPVHPAHLLDREGALLQAWVDDGRASYVP